MITVLNPGIYTSIQDLGRPGFAHIGVPISGVMDSYSAKIGNQILNNESAAAVIEITFGGCQFRFNTSTWICITGADFNATINGVQLTMNSLVKVDKDAMITFGKRVKGVRTYICVQGGIQFETVLKSNSYYKGITPRFILRKGDELKLGKNPTEIIETHSKIKIPAAHFTSNTIVCSKGPEFNLLSDEQQERLTKNLFAISNDNNRMGYRLEEQLKNNLDPILTSGVLPGTVQLTPSGTLIVLMRDCQVTGGYPRVLQLTKQSINRLAQKATGEKLQFRLQ